MVLLTVVLVIALLGVLVMQYNYLSGLDVMMAVGARDSTEAFFLAQAGISQAIRALQEDKLEDLTDSEEGDAGGEQTRSVASQEEETGYDGLDEDWAQPQMFSKLGRGEFIFKITDEDRKLNINLLLEDAVTEVAAARTLAAGGTEEEVQEKTAAGERRDQKDIDDDRKKVGKAQDALDVMDDKEEKGEEDKEIEVDQDSAEYLRLKVMLEKVRDAADEADGIDPFVRRLFDTPVGMLDAIVEWFENKEAAGPGEFERSGPIETVGELTLLKGVPREMLAGYPRREEIPEKKPEGEDGLVLIDPWAPKPFEGLRGFLTVYGDGKVNINTAPLEVLEVMLQDDNDDQSSLAADIIAAREELPFEKIENVNDDEYLREKILSKFTEGFKVNSEYFSILSEGRIGKTNDDGTFEGTTARIRAVVQRQDERIVICYWRVEE